MCLGWNSELSSGRSERHKSVLQMFLEHLHDINMRNPSTGDTLLHVAVEKENCVAVSLLLEKGADINSKNMLENTPLHVAVARGNLVAVRLLLDKGADINCRNKLGDTPLYVAATGGSKSIHNSLEEEADVTLKNKEENLLLDAAIKIGKCKQNN